MNNNIYTFKNLNRQEIEAGLISLHDIVSNQLHGLIINNFLSPDEVALLIKGLRNTSDSNVIHIEKDFDSYPMSFAQFDQMLERNLLKEEDYFLKSEEFINSFVQKFGVDIVSKMKTIFASIKDAPGIEIPKKPNTNNKYVPFTFRELFPGEGCLKAHCENLFFQEFPSFFEKINAFSTLDNQLSFFIVLQKPELGGELTLFDIIWNKNQKRLNDNEIVLQDNTHYQFENEQALKRDYHHPEVGSLVLFSGGKIWHRVEKVQSQPSRITLGGFLSFSHDGKTLYSWS